MMSLSKVFRMWRGLPSCKQINAVWSPAKTEVLAIFLQPTHLNTLKRNLSSSSKVMKDFSGIFPPIATPFKENEDIYWEKLKDNLDIYNKASFAGYVVQGSNGEYVSLSHEERVDMIKFVKENVPSDKLILAGSACEGTRETVSLSLKMADAGADAVLVATPSFFKNRMNNTAMIKHYSLVADACPIPVLLYNVPSNTGVELPIESIIHLSKHPNIVGLKDSGGDITRIGSIIHECGKNDFQVIAGSAGFLIPALSLGACGGVLALANVLPHECCNVYELYKEGKFEEARDLHLSLIKPNAAVTRKYNVPALKYAMDMLGLYGGPCRSPLTPVTEPEAVDIKSCFEHIRPIHRQTSSSI